MFNNVSSASLLAIQYYGQVVKSLYIMSEIKRIAEMVENWKKEGRAFSNVKNDDSKFFTAIKKKASSVGITSQTGNDLLYYKTTMYASDSDAIKSRKIKR